MKKVTKTIMLAVCVLILTISSATTFGSTVNAVVLSGASWTEVSLGSITSTYGALATNVSGGWAMGAKTDGGLDAIQYTTSWQATPLVGGVASMTFNALCYDGGNMFAANAAGGVGTIGYVTSWEYTPLLGGQVTGTYAALTKNTAGGWYYGANTDGGVSVIYYNNVWSDSYLVDNSVKYVAIADHITNGWAMAAREDGGVDAILYDNSWKAVSLVGTVSNIKFNALTWYNGSMFAANAAGGVGTIYYDSQAGGWVYTALSGTVSATYSALSPHQSATNWFYGSVVPEPATVAILALGGLLIRKRR